MKKGRREMMMMANWIRMGERERRKGKVKRERGYISKYNYKML